MKPFKLAATLCFLLALTVVSISCSHDPPSNAGNVCKHPFALCTSAPCVPLPGDATKAICTCDVEEGPSYSTASCDATKPRTDSYGITTLYSAYSFEQFNQGKKGMNCPSGKPWTWCLNKTCTVNPSNPKKAICTCDVKHTGAWMTVGGDCNTSTCDTGYWSGATTADIEEATNFMMKDLGIKDSPIKWCPATAP